MTKILRNKFLFCANTLLDFVLSCRRMQVCCIVLWIALATSCNEQPKAIMEKEIKSLPAQNSQALPEIPVSAGDLGFVVMPDTVSTHGPRSITRNILQDKSGNYWLATWEGLIRYDGNVFTNITLKEGLNHFHVFSLVEDSKGNLWFGTIGGGVYRCSPATGGKSFTLFTTKDGLAGDKIMCIMEDKEGNIWLGTSEGVSRFDGNTFTNFTKQDGLSDNFVSAIAQDKTGRLWFGTNGGVSCAADIGASLRSGPSTIAGTVAKSFTDFTISADLSFHNVRSIFKDTKGIMWIGSEEGLFRYDPAKTEKLPTIISKNSISYVFEDKSGNLWLDGIEVNIPGMTLSRYDPSASLRTGGKPITNVVARTGNKDPFFNQIFGGIEDRDGKIWFGTANGIWRYDPASGRFSDFSENVHSM